MHLSLVREAIKNNWNIQGNRRFQGEETVADGGECAERHSAGPGGRSGGHAHHKKEKKGIKNQKRRRISRVPRAKRMYRSNTERKSNVMKIRRDSVVKPPRGRDLQKLQTLHLGKAQADHKQDPREGEEALSRLKKKKNNTFTSNCGNARPCREEREHIDNMMDFWEWKGDKAGGGTRGEQR